MRRAIFALIGWLAFGAPAAAQTAPERQVAAALDQGAGAHAARGHRPIAGQSVSASLRVGDSRLWPIEVQAGRTYVAYGACDGDCRDVDLEIFDVDGAFAERDIAVDATPFVQLTPTRSGRAFVRVWIAECRNEPCTAGARLMAGGTRVERPRAPEAAAGGGANAYTDYVSRALDRAGARHVREGYAAIARPATETIAAVALRSEGHSVGYALNAGATYRFQAACDQDCDDVDIEVLDPQGRRVARDVAVNSDPFVDVRAAAAGAYSVRVWLAACSVEPCFVGVRGYGRR